MFRRFNPQKFPVTIIQCLMLILALVFGSRALVAQVDQGTITGTITDSQGALLPGAKITLTQIDTGLVLQGTSNSAGIYVFSPVKIGRYSVTAAASGFQTMTQTGLTLSVNQTLVINLSMRPGEVTTSVTVQGSAAQLLQQEDASTGQIISSKVINETPLAMRNYVFIAQLAPGVTEAQGSRGQGRGDFNANGLRAEQNNFILDGVDNNSNQVDFLNGASYVVKPPPDALAEFKVQTGSYDAEFGHSAGAVINAAIKSGTNSIHGNVWEYVRNNDLGLARDYFNRRPKILPGYHQNQFGATLGGPFLKNKLFWFGDMEVLRLVSASATSFYNVPTAKMRNGDFSELLNTSLTGNSNKIFLFQPGSAGGPNPGQYGADQTQNPYVLKCGTQINVFCPGTFDTVAQKILQLYPSPNTGAAGQTYNNFAVNPATHDNTVQWDVRLDWNPSQQDQAFFRMSYYNERGTYVPPFGPTLDGGGYGGSGSNVNMGENYALSETHIFNPSLINEFRFGYNWGHPQWVPLSANTNVSAQNGLGGIPFSPGNGGFPNTAIGGLSGIGGPQWYPAIEYENVMQFLDNVTKVAGRHTIKAGAMFQHVRVATTAPVAPHGTYNWSGFYTGIPGNAGRTDISTGFGGADFLADNFTPPGAPAGSTPGSLNSAGLTAFFNIDNVRWYRAGYVQDTWKMSRRLTANLGLRYENFQPIEERHDHQSLWYPNTIAPGAGTGTFMLADSQKSTFLAPGFLNLLAKDHINLVYSGTRSLVKPQYTQFAPRVGFTYAATNKMVVRAGFGLFYGGLESIGGAPNLGYNYPFQYSVNYSRTSTCNALNCPSIGQNYGINIANGFSTQPGWNNGLANSPNPSTPSLVGAQPQYKTPYTQQWNLAVQYALSSDMSWTVAYVGNNSRHIQGFPDQNGRDGLLGQADVANRIRPFPDFGGSQFDMHEGVSTYNSFQTSFQKHYTNGLSFFTNYTWGHALDDTQTPLNGGGNLYRMPLLLPMIIEFTNSDWDVRHRFSFNGQYDLPFGEGRKFLNHHGVVNQLAGGWSTDLVFTAQTGLPFSVNPNNTGANGNNARHAYVASDPYKAGGSPNATNPGTACATSTRNLTHWYNPCAFNNPKDGNTIPNTQTSSNPADGAAYLGKPLQAPADILPYLGPARNQLYGPGYNRINMSLFKSFPTFREQRLQFRADAFNLFNTPAFNNPNGSVNSNGGLISGTHNMGQFTPNSRFLQLALKYDF
ncbi:MAG TPA: carboxypeptidase regulatory-like domain-containing protein [Terracidiphilus sp.]|nr:carboxypeptidase regulatory-like domain-containing protein [Terracidiphilus sp.]